MYKKMEPAPCKPRLANPLDASKFDSVDSDDDSSSSMTPYMDDGSEWDKDF